MYVIMGATGNVGGGIADALLARGKKVRAVGRSAEKLQALADVGAEAAVGDAADGEFLKDAFKGAEAVFFMIPPNFRAEKYRDFQNLVIDNAIAAIKENGVEYVVTLSSQGAHLSEDNGPVSGLYDMEHKFAELEGVNVLHLRPTYFMENTFMYIDMIKGMGGMASNLKADNKFSMIATKDIAEAAAETLSTLGFTGKSVKDLLGQRDLSMAEVTKILGEAIGKPDLTYVEVPADDVTKGLFDIGLPAELANGFPELNERINDGKLFSEATRNAENTTKTPFEEFAKTFAVVYGS